jgi:hypothetical protein
MHPSRNHLAATILAVLLNACFSPELPEQIVCGEHGDCPPGLRCETSAGICVPDDQAGIATLRFVTSPASAEALVAGAAVTVELLDSAGQRVPLTGGLFTLEVAANPRGVGLVSPLTGTADAGIVTFSATDLDRPGRAIRLVARAGGLAVTSAPFDVRPSRPVATIDSSNEELSSCAPVTYKLTQAQSLPVDLLVEVDPDGPSGPEPFRRATQAASDPGMAGVQGVRGTPDGANRVFSWNTSADLPLRDIEGQLRITPSVQGVAGAPAVRDVTIKNGLRFRYYAGSNTPNTNYAIDIADTNHDGRPGVIMADTAIGSVQLEIAAINIPANVPVNDGATGDFDGNGLVDVAVALEDRTLISLQLRSSPPGAFADVVAVQDAAPMRELVSADFDHDGVDDVAGVEAASGAVVVLHGSRATPGQLVRAVRLWSEGSTGSLHVADLDRDGWPDLVIGRSSPTAAVVIVRGTPTGFMAPTLSGLTGDALATGDLDHDGRDDIAALEADGLHISSATGMVHVPGIAGEVVGLGDVDGDGRTDVVTVSHDVVEVHAHVPERGTIAFAPPSSIGVAPAVTRLLILDRDLDGLADIQAFTSDLARQRAFIGETPRRCGARLSGRLGVSPGTAFFAPHTADLNADGKVDMLDQQGQVAYGLGDGSFISRPDPLFVLADARFLGGVVPADYDGDGAMDVAFATLPTGPITVLYNDAADPGRFDRSELVTDVAPQLLASGDLDGDGALDLVGASSGQIEIRHGDPAGKRIWSAPIVLPAPIEGIFEARACKLLLEDLDRDGHLDILVGTPTRLLAILADPTAPNGFADPIVRDQVDEELIVAANLLPDGRRALVSLVGSMFHPQHLAVYALDASRTSIETVWEGPTDPDGTGAGDGAVADGDGNGLDEVLVQFQGLSLISAAPELSVRSVSPGWPAMYRLLASDVDGDGVVEIIGSGPGGTSVTQMAKDGRPDEGETISPRGASPGDGMPGRMALGDFTGDGLADLATVDHAGKVWLARQAPEQPGQLEAEEMAFPAAQYVALGDLDGDRRSDLITPGSGGSLAYLDIDAASPQPRCTAASTPGPVAVGDLTEDGIADVVTASASAVLLFENPAAACSAPVTVMSLERPGATMHRAETIALADMNVDGLLDVVVISDAIRIALQIPGAPGTFQVSDFEYEDVPPYSTYYGGVVADVDQDGQPDVIAIGKFQELRVFIGNPFFPGKLLPSVIVPGSGASRYPNIEEAGISLAFGDLQGDYWPDIVTVGGRETRVYLDAGFGNYSFAYSLVETEATGDGGGVSVVDFDRDGRSDVVYVDSHSGTTLLRGR